MIKHRIRILSCLTGLLCLTIAISVFAQQPAPAAASQATATPRAPRVLPEDNRPPVFLRESFKETATGVAEVAVTQDYVLSSSLELKLYGPGGKDVNIVHHATPKDEPSYIWTGLTTASWGLTLRDKANYADLTSPVAKIKWRTKMAGFHLLRPLLKLADGTMLVGDYTEGFATDWHENEINIADVRWRGFDPMTGLEANDGRWKPSPDLSKIDEIGFTDLQAGTGHGSGGSARIDWIEVDGVPVKR